MATVQRELPVEAVPLGLLPATSLRALFEEERLAWRRRLLWDTREAPEIALQAVASRLLDGAALRAGSRLLGFLSLQPGRGVARPCGAWIAPGVAAADVAQLAHAALRRVSSKARLEGQLLAFSQQDALDAAMRAAGCAVESREYLIADLPLAPGLGPAAALPVGIRLVPAGADLMPACADVLVEAHRGGVEARINGCFRTSRTAHEYLTDLVVGSGCGEPWPDVTRVALLDGEVAGFCVATRIDERVGHVPQIAVRPGQHGAGIGRALLRSALHAFDEHGAAAVTLSVSRENARARAWYARLGFRPATVFAAYTRARA